MNKKIVLVLCIALLLSLSTSFSSYADGLLAPELLKELGVLKGDLSGNLMLDQALKRQDLVVLLSRLYKEENKASGYLLPPDFKDLNEDNLFYHSYIKWAVDKKLIIGMSEEIFGYGFPVKVQDFQVVLLRALDYKEESSLYSSVPEIAAKLGIMKNLDLKPSASLLRKDMAFMTLNALELNKKGSPLTLAKILELNLNIEVPEKEDPSPKEPIGDDESIEIIPKEIIPKENIKELKKEIQGITL